MFKIFRKKYKELETASEAELAKMEVPRPETKRELTNYIEILVARKHDYGTCAYAMSMAATATFNYVASKLGASGFQASCADLDVLSRTRDFKWGRLLNYEDLLYPQYLTEENYPSVTTLLKINKEELQKRAQDKLAGIKGEYPPHPNVEKHWRWLAAGQPKEDRNVCNEPEKLCLFCHYCNVTLGSPDWSDMTPGDAPYIECYKHHFEFNESNDIDALDFGRLIYRAKTCPDFRWHSTIKRR